MKQCSSCKITKPKELFNKNRRRKDGLQTVCKICNRIRSKKYYQENKEKHVRTILAKKKTYVDRNREFVYQYLLSHSCVDCGEADPVKLDFDHLKDKRDSISKMVNQGLAIATIQKEIDKCVVRCANCHRFKTCKELNWWTYRRHYGDLK